MPIPFYKSRRPAPKPEQDPHDRILPERRIAAAENRLEAGHYFDRWYLLSPEFDELPESIISLL